MDPARLAEIRARVEAARGSLTKPKALEDMVAAADVLKAHAFLDMPELLDDYDLLRSQAAALWDELHPHPHTAECPAHPRNGWPAANCTCDTAQKKNPYRGP